MTRHDDPHHTLKLQLKEVISGGKQIGYLNALAVESGVWTEDGKPRMKTCGLLQDPGVPIYYYVLTPILPRVQNVVRVRL
jgi:hypothetical protein